jgi:hypothetical protein
MSTHDVMFLILTLTAPTARNHTSTEVLLMTAPAPHSARNDRPGHLPSGARGVSAGLPA